MLIGYRLKQNKTTICSFSRKVNAFLTELQGFIKIFLQKINKFEDFGIFDTKKPGKYPPRAIFFYKLCLKKVIPEPLVVTFEFSV